MEMKRSVGTEELLQLQRETFDYFLDEVNPANGLIRDKTAADWPAMVRDMRNRFLVALVFSLPLFAMGLGEPLIRPPFGVSENLTMFVLASAAILYPVWPFAVAAWRALRNCSSISGMASPLMDCQL